MVHEGDFDDWDDDPWADDGWETAAVDAHLRTRVSGLYPIGSDSFTALHELQPVIASARRRRRSMQGVAASVALVALVAGGALAAREMMPPTPSSISAAGQARSGTEDRSGDAAGSESGIGHPKAAAEPSSSSTAVDPHASTTGSAADPDPTGPSISDSPATTPGPPGSGAPGTGGTTAVTGGTTAADGTRSTLSSTSTTRAPSSTTAASTRGTVSSTTSTTSRSTTSTTSGRVSLTSRCGSIVVLVNGNRVDLLEVHPNSGGRSDIHETGPQLVDVTLYDRSAECQITAQIRDGRLVTSQVDD